MAANTSSTDSGRVFCLVSSCRGIASPLSTRLSSLTQNTSSSRNSAKALMAASSPLAIAGLAKAALSRRSPTSTPRFAGSASHISSYNLSFRGSLPRDACGRSGWYPSPYLGLFPFLIFIRLLHHFRGHKNVRVRVSGRFVPR